MTSMRTPHLTARLQGFGTTVFAEMTRLAQAHDAVNLGQGFPDFDPPAKVAEAAITAIRAGHNQYAPTAGIPTLRRAISEHQQRFWGLPYDPDDEVTVTAGATEGICASLQALCDTGDEVVLLEPAYDAHRAGVAMAGAAVKPVLLRPPGFSVDADELAAAITAKTRAIVMNNPHNPSGKVFTRDELEAIAGVCRDRDLLAVTDEVYEHLVYRGQHVPLAGLPGMRERTVTISSAAKTFSVTGWKVGWVCAPPALTTAVRTAKQFMTFTNGTPFQHAVATALRLGDDYFDELRDAYGGRHQRLADGLAAAGFSVHPADGSYFVTVDIGPLGADSDVAFCLGLPQRVGVAAVPLSGFYSDPRNGSTQVRFACCKGDSVIDEGLARLQRLRG